MAEATGRQKTIKASFVLFGTIVGAGIFGLPYVVQKAGYLPGLFWMLVLAVAVTLTHLLYGEVILATPGDHRLVGYVRMYLGPWAGRVEVAASILGLFGGSLAYLILGGLFISRIFEALGAGVSAPSGAFVLFLFGLAAAWFGTKFLSGVDFWLTLVEFGSFVLLSVIAFTAFSSAHVTEIHLSESFLPYGVVLFAYGGLSAVSEVRNIAGGDPARVRRSIIAGTLMAASLTVLFVTSVVGALGPGVTEEAVGGLNAKFGGPLPLIGAVAGFFSILTSYIVFSEYLKSQFQRDFGWPRTLSVALAVGTPFVLYLLGVRSFGAILELVGAVLIGLEGIFVALMYLRVKKLALPMTLRIPDVFIWLLATVYAAGGLYEILHKAL